MKSYLVTGGAGFIGSHLAKRLLGLEKTSEITIIDNLSTGYLTNIPKKCHFIEGNVFSAEVIEKLNNKKFTAVFHIAGQSSADVSFDDPLYDFKTNAESTLRLLDYCKNSGTDRVLFASTMSVYGDAISPVTEQMSLNPNSFYGVGKITSEHYLRLYQKYGINSTSLRLFNVYGPGQNMKNLRQGMVSIFMHHILSREKLLIMGDKKRYRDFIYIDDVVDAFLLSLESSISFNKIYNIGTSIQTTVEQLVEKIFTATGVHTSELEVLYQGNTQGDQYGIFANNSLFNTDLNWSPKMDLSNGLKVMSDYYKQFKEYQ